MQFETILISETANIMTITMHRPRQRNSIDIRLLKELQHAIIRAEQNPTCRVILLQGEDGIFCTGMDFEEVIANQKNTSNFDFFSKDYMYLLKKISTSSKIIISYIDGQVLAGGVGIVAASDLAISTNRSQFTLPEALWGMLPACVLPYLIRRIGFQKSFYLSLLTQTISVSEAHKIGLIDEVTDNFEETLNRLLSRINRVQEETIKELKGYLKKLWIINKNMEEYAIEEITRLVKKPKVQGNIKNFVEKQQFPWDISEN